MRQIYSSPHQKNIDRLVALLKENGIACSVANQSRWNRQGYKRFGYTEQREERDSWPQVWVEHADDYTRSRELLRGLGIDPVIRHAAALAASRNPSPVMRRRSVAARVRRIALLAIAAVFVLVMLRYMNVF